MKREDIRYAVDRNNEAIQGALRPNQFTLNSIVAELLKENEMLQEKCEHHFDKNFCIYCDKHLKEGE